MSDAELAVAVENTNVFAMLTPSHKERIVRLLIKKVVVTPYTIEVQFRPNGVEILATEMMVKKHKAVTQEMAA